ncbi:MAG: hypothetical protein J0M12_03565 [Deltaproteobacteria bacterium]|nr:hypothetical protein [Deltaproteobacteria bacterium]
MFDFNSPSATILLCGFTLIAMLHCAVSLFVYYSLRAANREREITSKELFGLMKKIEGLTASRREHLLKEYDKILENLTHRLPPIIAAQASESIIETESRILTRLAELEPNLKKDDISFKKMDELIQSMEKLEQTLVTSTAETVERVLVESRTVLLEQQPGEFET